MRREYSTNVMINNQRIVRLLIDPHYERKHRGIVNDAIIRALVETLDGIEIEPQAVDDTGFRYYVTEPHILNGRPFRLVWLLPADGSFLGVVNCYRRPRAKE